MVASPDAPEELHFHAEVPFCHGRIFRHVTAGPLGKSIGKSHGLEKIQGKKRWWKMTKELYEIVGLDVGESRFFCRKRRRRLEMFDF